MGFLTPVEAKLNSAIITLTFIVFCDTITMGNCINFHLASRSKNAVYRWEKPSIG